MNNKFMHVAHFGIKPDNREQFIQVIEEYENNVEQKGLNHSHLIEAEFDNNQFWYVTIWDAKSSWEAVEELPAHIKMHKERDPLLAQPTNQNIGTLIF